MNSKQAYGYLKSPSDKHQLIIDDDAAEVVRRIFNMYAAGYTGRCIAETLTKEGIPNPRTYHYSKSGKPNPYSNDFGSWNSGSISNMLKNQVYIGNMVQGKRKTISFKSKKVRQLEPEQWVIVPGTHEPIIETDVWSSVQARLISGYKAKTRTVMKNGLFSGIIRCAECGSALAFNAKPRANGVKHIYKCSRYANNGKVACSTHYVDESEIEQLILNDIRHYALLAVDRNALTERLVKTASTSQDKEFYRQRSRLTEAERKLSQLDDKIRLLFEDKVAGNISGSIYTNLMSGYDKERGAVEQTVVQLQKELAVQETRTRDVSKWVDLIHRNIDICKLDRETVFELVEGIIISETFDANGKSCKAVNIKYKFVGYLASDEKSIVNF